MTDDNSSDQENGEPKEAEEGQDIFYLNAGKENLFAAVRLYVEPTKVKVVPVVDILAFDVNEDRPYDAFIKSGFDALAKPVHEPGLVLQICIQNFLNLKLNYHIRSICIENCINPFLYRGCGKTK